MYAEMDLTLANMDLSLAYISESDKKTWFMGSGVR